MTDHTKARRAVTYYLYDVHGTPESELEHWEHDILNISALVEYQDNRIAELKNILGEWNSDYEGWDIIQLRQRHSEFIIQRILQTRFVLENTDEYDGVKASPDDTGWNYNLDEAPEHQQLLVTYRASEQNFVITCLHIEDDWHNLIDGGVLDREFVEVIAWCHMPTSATIEEDS